jgi:hypothetical protein
MSIRHLTTPQNFPLPLYTSGINGVSKYQLNVNLAAAKFSATPATPILDFGVQGFLFNGTDKSGATPSAILQFYFEGGILGTCTVAIKSKDFVTTYFSGVLPVNNTSTLTLTPGSALPATLTPLILVISSDATANSSFYPLVLTLNY